MADAFCEDEGAASGSVCGDDGIDDQFLPSCVVAEGGDHVDEVVGEVVCEAGGDGVNRGAHEATVFFEVAFLESVDDLAEVEPEELVHAIFAEGSCCECDAIAGGELW